MRTIPLESGDPVADQRRRIVVELLVDIRRHHKTMLADAERGVGPGGTNGNVSTA